MKKIILLSIALLMCLGLASATLPVDLGSASSFAILSKTGITNIPTSNISSDVGAYPVSGSTIELTCSEVTGTIYDGDGAYPNATCLVTNASALSTAVNDMELAYNDSSTRTPDYIEGVVSIDDRIFTPGVYSWASAVTITADKNITINGSSTDIFIFQIAGYMTTGANSQIILTGGAKDYNVFWTTAGYTSIGANALFQGNILDKTYIAMGAGSILNGRALSQTAVTLDSSTINNPLQSPECVIDTDCGSCMYCDAGTCENQTNTDLKVDCGLCQYCDGTGSCINQSWGEDVKDECTFAILNCVNPYSYNYTADWCSIDGSCIRSGKDVSYGSVSQGQVCINETNYNEQPTAEHNCGTWSDCLQNATIANEYYTGYTNDGTGNCTDTDWQSAGTIWNATAGYQISTTEKIDTCQEELLCTENWTCSLYGSCMINNTKNCLNTTDQNNCGNTYTGDYSEFTTQCTYTTPQTHGGSNFPETTLAIAPTPSQPTTFSLGGFLISSGLNKIWQDIKNWLLSIGIKI